MGSAVAVKLSDRLKGKGRYGALVLHSTSPMWPHLLWVLHGEADKTVPIRLGRRLFELAPEPKHWTQWPLGHSRLHTDPTGRCDQTWRDIWAACETP